MTRRTSTDYRNPYRPLSVRIGNAVAGLWPVSLAPQDLIGAARRMEGLDDFGDPDPLEPLAVLCDAMEREARLHPLGRFIQRQRIVGALRARLRVQAIADNAVDLEPPIVIAGLQRTGTTLLHRLLAADGRFRALRSWEALNPAPYRKREYRRREYRDEDPRMGVARRAEGAVRWLAPDFFAVHPIAAEAPEEEVVVLDQALISTVPEALMSVPTYAAWVESTDPAPAYTYLRTALGVLTAQQGPACWVLKTPHHLEFLDALLAAFPGARIVWTHRDPKETLPSFCSMVAHAYGLSSDHVDPIAIGAHWRRKTERMVAKGKEVRARVGDGPFVDVEYGDLVADPMSALARLYDALGLDLPDDSRSRIEAALRTERQDRHGHHVYRPEDFGLS